MFPSWRRIGGLSITSDGTSSSAIGSAPYTREERVSERVFQALDADRTTAADLKRSGLLGLVTGEEVDL